MHFILCPFELDPSSNIRERSPRSIGPLFMQHGVQASPDSESLQL